MSRSVAIIGAGQIGYALALAFATDGWEVTVYSRTRPHWQIEGTHWQSHEVGRDTAPAADVLIDTIAFDDADVARYDPDRIGRLIAVSSASVYCDEQGRTLDEAAHSGFPEFGGPITEDQSTVAPGPKTYSTRKVRMEMAARELFGDQATILRPCAIYGAWSRHPREWWFVKRMLDGRRRIPLSFEGKSQFHTTSANMMAWFTVAVAEQNLGGTFNIADDFAAEVALLGWRVAEELGVKCELLRFDGSPKGSVGRTPWSVPKPFEVSCKSAYNVGWDGFTTYPGVGNSAIAWLRDFDPDDWRSAFPQLAAYPWDLFDYAAEDAWLDG